jgi:hypothetical protein
VIATTDGGTSWTSQTPAMPADSSAASRAPVLWIAGRSEATAPPRPSS